MTDLAPILANLAYAMAAPKDSPQSAGDIIYMLAPFILIIVVFYWLILKPQQKKQREMSDLRTNLKKGDRVITSSGIYGTVMQIDENTAILRIADNAKIKILKNAIIALESETGNKIDI